VAGRFLGIDVGGTAARWVVVDEAGAEIARGSVAGATGHLFNPAENARFVATMSAIEAATAPGITAVHAGITGLGPETVPDACTIMAETFGLPVAAVSAGDDVELAFRAAFAPGTGHLVTAGTGSIGLHITAAGEIIRVGGRGILVDDGGSGSWIALRAVDALYRRIDETGGPADAGRLAEALARAVGGADWGAMRAFLYGGDRGRIGTLATAVAEAAEAGDDLARTILAEAADELARLARALVARGGPLPVAVIGGVVELDPAIKIGLTRALKRLDVRFPRVDAALAGARIAAGRRGGSEAA
jgi:N-acetylglucosamine kinase-like BadF-type ATPase